MERALSVSQLNEYVRRTLASDPMLKGLRLRGEISNFKRHSAGHLYFSLKDEEARIACVMFRSAAAGMRVQPRDGMRVVLTGSASLYVAAGQYQFYVDGMRDDGVGALFIEFERLKEMLQREGLFDAGLKKPLPLLPKGVGIVTSASGAVVHDIEQVAKRRHPGVPLVLRPTLVQGEGAAEDIARAVAELDANEAVDVIIVGRGGGSLEELWAFNEEVVVRAIFESRTPVVSAVGHETDFTLADFAADIRAATPSAAAEIVVPRRDELTALLDGHLLRMRRAQVQRVALLSHRLHGLRARLYAHLPNRRIAQQRSRLSALPALMAARTQSAVLRRRQRLDTAGAQMTKRLEAALLARRWKLAGLLGRLDALAPQRVLERGYAVATLGGHVLSRAGDAHVGDLIHITLREGALGATVTEESNGCEKTGKNGL